MSMRQQLYDILKISHNSFMDKVHTAIPGTIESYDATIKKASVKPLIKKKLENDTISFPVIPNVPVVFPCSKDAIIAFPLSRGDGCLIIFSEADMERYLSSAGQEVDPESPERFKLSDAICIPGLFPFGNHGKTGGALGLEVIYKNSKVTIDDTGITLESGDATAWLPNIIALCPMTGLPHGGPGAGIFKLRGK